MQKDQWVVQEFDTLYDEAYYAWNPFYPLADKDLRFYLGDQWDEQEKRQLFQDGRSTFVFNRIRPVINFITGYQRQRRHSSVVVPVEDGDQQVADQMTKVLFHVFTTSNGYQMISEAFSGAVKTGWNLLSLWMDYTNDPENGDICFSREPYNGFICDPYFTRLDWSDCNYVIRRKYLSADLVGSLLPGMEKEVKHLNRMGYERDDKFTWLPYQRQPGGEELMAYNEMFFQKWRQVDHLMDKETGMIRKWPGEQEPLDEFVAMNPEFTKVKKPERYIEKKIIVNDQYMKSEINPNGLDEYPFANFMAIFEPESDQWELKVQSYIRSLIDPQRETNRRRSQMVDIMDSQINSGWIADENSVVNPRSLFQTSQGKVVWRREDAKPGAVEKIPAAQVPPSLFQMQELFDKDIKDIAGVNDAAFGQMESANESGVMQLIRQGSSIANMQELFDNLRLAQQSISKKIVKMVQQWSPEKIQRIINQPVAEGFFDPNISKYDIEITEGTVTATQKQLYFRQLVELQQLGAPVTGEMLAKAAPIQGKTEYLQELQKMEQQQQQAQQQQQEIQERVLQSQENLNQAKAIGEVALGKERFTRAVANMGLEDERASASVENRSDAMLNRVRAIKELEQMDEDRFIKLLEFFMQLEDFNKQKEAELKSDDVNISAQALNAQAQQAPQQGINQPMEVQDENVLA